MDSYKELKEKINLLFKENETIYLVGTSSTGKTTLINNLINQNDNLISIQFDNLLLENFYNTLKENMNKDDFNYINNFFGENLAYYIRHHNCDEEHNPFIIKFKKEHTNNEWEKVSKILKENYIKLPNGIDNRKKCLEKLFNLIKISLDSGKKILIDIAYISPEEIILMKEKYKTIFIYVYLSLKYMVKAIKKRNNEALEKNTPFHYRHPIFVFENVISYLKNETQFFMEEFTKEKLYEDVIKFIPIIDPYYLGFMIKSYCDIHLFDKMNYPIKIYAPNFSDFVYRNRELEKIFEEMKLE